MVQTTNPSYGVDDDRSWWVFLTPSGLLQRLDVDLCNCRWCWCCWTGDGLEWRLGVTNDVTRLNPVFLLLLVTNPLADRWWKTRRLDGVSGIGASVDDDLMCLTNRPFNDVMGASLYDVTGSSMETARWWWKSDAAQLGERVTALGSARVAGGARGSIWCRRNVSHNSGFGDDWTSCCKNENCSRGVADDANAEELSLVGVGVEMSESR